MKDTIILDILSKIENLIEEGNKDDALEEINSEIMLLSFFSDKHD